MGQDELPQGVTSAVHRGSTAALGLPTLVLGAEAALTVVAIRGEVQPKPVLAADDRGWEAGSSEPVGTGRGQGQEPQMAGTGDSPLPMQARASARWTV